MQHVAGDMERVIERWNAAIADVLARVDATLADASAGSLAVIAHIGSDLGPLVRPWAVVEHQMHQYSEQIAQAWNRIGDDRYESINERKVGNGDWKTEWKVLYTRADAPAVAK